MKRMSDRFIPLERRKVVVIAPGARIHMEVLACMDRTRHGRLFTEHLGLLTIARLVGYKSASVEAAEAALTDGTHGEMPNLVQHAVEHFSRRDEAAGNGLLLACVIAAADSKRLTEPEHVAVGGGVIPLLLPAAAIVAYLKCATMTHFVVPRPGQTSRRASAAHLLRAAYTTIGMDATDAMCRLLLLAMARELTVNDVVNVFAAQQSHSAPAPVPAEPSAGNRDGDGAGRRAGVPDRTPAPTNAG